MLLDKEPARIEMKFNVPFGVILKTNVEAFIERGYREGAIE